MEDHAERKIMNCPYSGRECVDGLRDDFKKSKIDNKIHKCRLWVGVAGKLPQSEQVVLHYDCADAWKITTMIEQAQTNRFAAASSDKVANVQNEFKGFIGKLSGALNQLAVGIVNIGNNQKKIIDGESNPSITHNTKNGEE